MIHYLKIANLVKKKRKKKCIYKIREKVEWIGADSEVFKNIENHDEMIIYGKVILIQTKSKWIQCELKYYLEETSNITKKV